MTRQLSIIVPAYNAEATIVTCISSIIRAGTHALNEDFEILVVDDGSTDRTPQLLQQLASAHPQVVIFTQRNMGRSIARNVGIDHAQGRYLMFCDSDDILPVNGIKHLMSHHPDVDVVCGQYLEFQDSSAQHLPPKESLPPHHSFSVPRELQPLALTETEGLFIRSPHTIPWWLTSATSATYMPVWAKRYRADIIQTNGIRFVPGLRFGEDTVFNLTFIHHASTMHIISDVTYYWYTGVPLSPQGGTVQTFRRSDYAFLQKLADAYCTLIEDHPEYSALCGSLFLREVNTLTARFFLHATPTPRDFKALIEQFASSQSVSMMLATISTDAVYTVRRQKMKRFPANARGILLEQTLNAILHKRWNIVFLIRFLLSRQHIVREAHQRQASIRTTLSWLASSIGKTSNTS